MVAKNKCMDDLSIFLNSASTALLNHSVQIKHMSQLLQLTVSLYVAVFTTLDGISDTTPQHLF